MQQPEEKITKLITLTKIMRTAQKAFFKAKRTNNLNISDYEKKMRAAEKAVDNYIVLIQSSEVERRQQKMF